MEQLIGLAEQIAERLKARGETVAVAESSAGGLIAAALLAVPGASAYFLGGAVVYTRQARRCLLAIPDAAMMDIRSASEPYAALLTRTVRERHGATWGLAETGATVCTPTLRPADEAMVARPFIDDFSAGYIRRVVHLLPKQGDAPWVHPQNYTRDRQLLLKDPVADGVIQFSRPRVPARA